MKRISLRGQLILWNALTLTALLVVLGLVTRFAATSAILYSVDRTLEDRIHPPHHGPPPQGQSPQGRGGTAGQPPPVGGPGPDGPPDGPDQAGPPGGADRPPPPDDPDRPYHPRFFDAQGKPQRPGGEAAWDPAALVAARRGGKVFTNVTSGGEALRVLTRPAGPGFVVQAAYPLADVNRAVAGLDRALLLLIPVALLGAGLGGALLTGRVLRPVRQITDAAARMGDAPSARLPKQGEDEFGAMADTFNGLLGRLEGSFQHQARLLDQQRRFTADASHELKSPLTIIQGTASQMGAAGLSEEDRREAAGEVAQAAEGMARLVGDLLLLARSDEGRLGRSPMSVLAREVLTQAAARVPGGLARVCVRLEDESLALWGNEEELTRLLANLLQNAAQATPKDGEIIVSARRQGPSVVVTVADTGAGIRPEHLSHLGERFYRVDAARARRDGGTGLGLSICRGIVEAHGGALAFASELGKGTTVTVTLPAGPV